MYMYTCTCIPTSLPRFVEWLVSLDQINEGWSCDEDFGLLVHDISLPLDGHIDDGHDAAGHHGNLKHDPRPTYPLSSQPCQQCTEIHSDKFEVEDLVI